MFRFENDFYLYFLIIIPVLFFLLLLYYRKRSKILKLIASDELGSVVLPNNAPVKFFLKYSILIIALAMFIIALANPQIGTKYEKVKRKGAEIVVAIDISNSMKCEDIKPNRLERAKLLVSRLIDKLEEDKIGIILFAGGSYQYLPLTTDYSAAKLLLSNINTDLISTQGTAIGSAIDLANKSLAKSKLKSSKTIIVVTDGENHEDDAVGLAEEAKDAGMIIHTIGMGTINGGTIPINNSYNNYEFIKNDDGSYVISKLNPDVLKSIANAGGGKFIRSAEQDIDLTSLIKEISGLKKTEFKEMTFTDYEDRFYIFVVIGFALIILELMISNRKNKILDKLNKLFFNEQNV